MKVFRKFLRVLSAVVTVLCAGSLAACEFMLDFTNSSKGSEQIEAPVRITAVYEQSTQVFADTPLDDLRADLTVSLEASAETSVETSVETLTETDDYTLSGTLAVGESEITVTYTPLPTLTTTFIVTVSEGNVHTHVFTNYVSDNNAACEKDGTKTAKCDYEFCQATDVVADEGSALEHVYTNYVSDNNAACEKDGTKTAECDNGCGTTKTVADEGSALEHVYTNYESDNNAACEKDGTKTAECDNGCGTTKTVTDEGSATGHAFGDWELTTAPTCTEKGEETRVCECKATETREVAAKNHNFGAWEVSDQPTCTKGGLEKRVCANDSTHVEERPLEKLPHEYSENWKHDTVNHWKECDCGDKTESGKHDWDDGTVQTPAGEDTKGVMLYTCTVCMKTKEESIAPLGHTHVPVKTPAKEATCTENGNDEYWYCSGCEKYFSDESATTEITLESIVIEAAHTALTTSVTAATCTEAGVTTTTCDDCDYENVETSSALGHSFQSSVCERCSATNNLSIETAPNVTSIYYGEQPTITAGVVQDELGETVSNGTWSISGVSYLASGAEREIKPTVTLTFTPGGTEYAPVTKEIEVTLLAVAKYGNNYYATIDGALATANASNSGKVYALPLGCDLDSGRAKIAKTIAVVNEIKSGVTLTLPYAEDALDTTVSYVFVETIDNVSYYKTSAYGKAEYLTNQIYIAEEHTLANAGWINVAGEVSSGKAVEGKAGENIANSMTAGRHAQINLGANAKLTSTGTVNCYGFINEETKNNGSEFIVEKGKATVMFTIVEYRGPVIYLGMLNPEKNSTVHDNLIDAVTNRKTYTPDTMQSSPFNRFYIESVTAKTTVNYGAQLLGHAVLNAYNEHCQTTLNLINDSDAIIALKQGSWVTYKYDSSSHKTKLDIYGDMTLNPLQLELTLTISGYSAKLMLTTGGLFFPISDYFDISLNAVNGSATVDASAQKVKLLPGATLTIGEGVEVNASEIAVYADNHLFQNGLDKHYTTSNSAELIVKGTLNVDAIGGEVKVGCDGARLNITKSNSVISKEIAGTNGRSKLVIFSLTGQGLEYLIVIYSSDEESTLIATGATVNGDPLGVNEYTAQNGEWLPANIAVQYNLNGGTASATSQSFVYGYELKASDLLVPEREYYDFAGWYTTENFESGTQFESVTLTKNLALYAKWEQKAGIVLVEFKAVGTDVNDVEITKTFASQVINADSKYAVKPTNVETYNGDVTYKRYVAGYYLDEACTVAFSFSQELTQNTTIYVKWADKIKIEIGSGTSSVTAGGKTVAEDVFYVVPDTEIEVSAKATAGISKKTVTIKESYGGNSASKSASFFGTATATLTFKATGDTKVTVTTA